MTLDPPNTSIHGRLAEEKDNQNQLTLSTVHSAKGLEWHTVFVIWAYDGRFPSIYALNSDDGEEEELRLMYVAATRAKERLFFTYPGLLHDADSYLSYGRPSRFLEIIPEDILERYSVSY
jgi:DNA helicase-2/ATP-dependent DNA helicase PcrA